MQIQISDKTIFSSQRTDEIRAFDRYLTNLRRIAREQTVNPKERAAVEKANRALVQLRDLGPNVVHIDAAMQEMSIRFANEAMIGERLMPVCNVGHRSNYYFKYSERSQLAFPDDSLSARSKPNEANHEMSDPGIYAALPRGLRQVVDMNDIANADKPLDPLLDALLFVNEGILWNREKRIATILNTASNYSGNVLTLGAGDAWNSANGGDPVANIQFAVDNIFRGAGSSRTIGFCSLNVFRTLSRHPAIRDLFKYNKDGFATAQQLAQYFELDELLVGKAWEDRANIGQTLDKARIWSDNFGVVVVANQPTPRSYCFGTTFRWRAIRTTQTYNPTLGSDGMYEVAVRLDEDHRVVAPYAGFLIENCFDANLV